MLRVDQTLVERLSALVDACYADQMLLLDAEMGPLERRSRAVRARLGLLLDLLSVSALLALALDARLAVVLGLCAVLTARARRRVHAGERALSLRAATQAQQLRQRWLETLPQEVPDAEDYNQLLRLANLRDHVRSAVFENERLRALERPALAGWALLWRVRIDPERLPDGARP